MLELKHSVVNKVIDQRGSRDKGHAFASRDIALNSCLIEGSFFKLTDLIFTCIYVFHTFTFTFHFEFKGTHSTTIDLKQFEFH